MKPAEIGITVLYFAACVAIALACARRAGRGAAAYWAAERSIGVWVNGFGTFSTLVSAASFLGFLGLTCRHGWSFTAIALGAGPTLGFVLSMLLVSGPLRRYSEQKGKFTLSNFFAERYGGAAGTIASLLVVLTFSLYIVPQLKGGSLAAEYLGIPSRWATLVVGGVFVLYVLVGGMISVTWTDFMQGILMFALMVGLAVTAAVHFGGLGGLVAGAEAVKPRFLELDPELSVWTCVGFPLGITIFVLSAPHTVMRLFTARDVRQGRAALALTAALCLVFHLVGYLGVGAAALILDPALENTDRAYVVAMGRLFPAWARGLGIAAILAAIMSTTAGLLLTAGAEFSANLYRRFLRPGAGERETLAAARAGMLAIGAVTTALALFDTRTIGEIVGQLVAAIGSAFAAPLILGIWWRRANAWGGALGIAGGFGSYVAAHYALDLPRFSEVLVSFPASIAGVVLGSLLSAPPRLETVSFVEGLHRSSPPSA